VASVAVPAVILLTACQSAGDASLAWTFTPASVNQGGPTLIQHPQILGVSDGRVPGQVIIQFGPGITWSGAVATGHEFGLNLKDGPVVTGPWASGMFTYEQARASIEADTPTTALVYFQDFVKPKDRQAFLLSNHLALMRWFHPDNGFVVARVKLPPANLHPLLVDALLGRFQISLPVGLALGSVVDWAKQNNLSVVGYKPDTGVAVVHPISWQPPIRPFVRVAPRLSSTHAPAMASGSSLLYAQFVSSVSSNEISTIAKGLDLTVLSINPEGLATLSAPPARLKAEIQLLSDIPSVQCVSTSPAACMPTAGGGTGTTSTPVMQSFAQPTRITAQVDNGVLSLIWNAASGATAYALFDGPSATGLLTFMGVVAGQSHTTLQVANLQPPGEVRFYYVVALRPCAQAGESSLCDVASISSAAAGGAGTSWLNKAPSAIASASPAPSPDPAPVTPLQTVAGPPPLTPPASAEAVAGDGHVILTWAPVQGATGYRIYRSTGQGPALYIAQTSGLTLTDIGGRAGLEYRYEVAAVAASGLVGSASKQAIVTWAAVTSTPSVLRMLPAEAGPLSGQVRFEVAAQSGSGSGSLQWRITGAAAAMTIGAASGQPIAQSPLGWSAALTWDTSLVPDGTYTVSATVIDAAGPQVTVTSRYRVQNGAPIGPTALNAVAQGGTVALTWSQPAIETGVAYRLFRDQPVTGAALAELSADARSYVDRSIAAGPHVYQLVLVDAAGHKSPAATVAITFSPAAATPVSDSLDIKLLLPNGQELAPGGRITERLLLIGPNLDGLRFQLSSDGRAWADLANQPRCNDVCEADLNVESLSPGPYVVRAATASGVGAGRSFVRAEEVRYGGPTDVTALSGPLGVTLHWSAPPSARPGSYAIERLGPNGDWHLLDQVISRSYVDTTAPAGARSTYRILAVDPEGNTGLTSAEVDVQVPAARWAQEEIEQTPAAPSGLVVLASHGRASLRWQHVTGADNYAVERQTEVGGPFARVAVTGAERFTDAPALSATASTYRVIALNGAVAGPPSDSVSVLVIPRSPPVSIGDSNQPLSTPSAPTSVAATAENGAVRLVWTAAAGSSPGTTYDVYRMNPSTGLFTQAATEVQTTAFVDRSLAGGATYGYVVTADVNGRESSFSLPGWSAVPQAGSNLDLNLLSSIGSTADFVQAPNFTAIAQVTASAGLAGISVAIRSGLGPWNSLAIAPGDPRAPTTPSPLLVAGAISTWSTTFDTQSIAPGNYELRVQVRDRAGRSREQEESVFIAGSDARGPPPAAFTTPNSGGVHLSWTASGNKFTIQRSLFGAEGPFESIGTTQSSQFDDRTAIPGREYHYRVIGQAAAPETSSIGGNVAPDAPSLDFGPVTRAAVSVTTVGATSSHPLEKSLTAVGSAFDILATSLATGAEVHRLGETAQLTFELPHGMSTVDAAAVGIYHWDEASAKWVSESGVTNPDSTTITATIEHLSQFVLAESSSTTQTTDPGLPPNALSQPLSLQGSPTTAEGQPWASLPVNPDGEIPALRTASSAVFVNENGGFRQVIGLGPLNYKDASGAWQKIDPAHVSDGSGGMRNAAGPLSFDLPSIAGPIRVDSAQGSMTMSILGAASSPLEMDSTSATYRSVLPGIDITYDVTRSGLNESLIITQPPIAPLAITYDLTTDGLTLALGQDGSVTAASAAGIFAFTLPAPWMMEMPNGQQLAGSPSTRVGVALTGSGGNYVLTYTPDQAWLQDAARRYPVVLDPSVTITNEADNAFNNCGGTWGVGWSPPTYDFPVGYDPNGCFYRWIMEFDSNESYAAFSCASCYAASAYLTAYEQSDNYRDPSGTGTEQFKVWPSQSQYNTGTNIGWQQVPIALSPSAPVNNPVGSGAMTFDITSIVQQWETTNSAGAGVLTMVGRETGTANSDIYVYSGDNTTYAPYMTINYAGGTITSSAPDPIPVQPGSIVSIPVLVKNTATDYTWKASDLNDVIRLGVLGYTSASGAWTGLSNQPRTFLPSDVGPGASVNATTLIQAPLDPGDYWYKIDLTRDVPTYPASKPATIWFSTMTGPTGAVNQPAVVHIRVLAPGDTQAAAVPVSLGDGTSLSVNTSNGSSNLAATDLAISELGSTSLTLSRTYNSVNGSLSSNSTNNSSITYGAGWTYNFQRNLQLGSWSQGGGVFGTLRNSAGLYTDSNGKSSPLTWNPGRGLWEDAAGGRTVTGPIPVDLLQRNGNPFRTDTSPPMGGDLYLDGAQPSALIFPAGSIPNQTSGSVEVWFWPNYTMSSDTAEHVLFTDTNGVFTLSWNPTNPNRQWCFTTKDNDTGASNSLCSAASTWSINTWHQIVVTWSQGANLTKTIYLDGVQAATVTTAANVSPAADVWFGYRAKGASGLLKGAISALRIDSAVLSASQVSSDFSARSATPTTSTLYLGTFNGNPNSAGTAATYIAGTTYGFSILTNPDQSQEIYDPGTGRLVATRDRIGNQIDYAWDGQNRITSISDHSLANRALAFCYSSACGLPSAASFRVADPGNRTVDYTVNATGDLVNVAKSNAVPDPLTGVVSQQAFSTGYGYTGGHLLQTIIDPRGARTRLNYDSSYAQVVTADLPSNHWRLGETSAQGGAADAANPCRTINPTACNGTYSASGVTFGQRGVTYGDPNTSIALDGANGSVSVTGTAVSAGAAYTVEAWVKASQTTGSRTIVAFGQGAGSGMLWLNGGVPTFRIGTASSSTDIAAGSALNAAWHHIVGSYDGANGRLYVDGQLAAGPTAVASGAGTSSFTIGSLSGTNLFVGNLDEVAVYPSALSSARIQSHYTAARLGVGASATGYAATVIADSPVGFWRLSEPGGNVAIDQSGFVGTGTYYGGYVPGGSPMSTDPATSTYFNGTGYVTLPTYSITNTITVEAWVYASTYNQSAFIVSKNPVNENWELFVANNTIYWRTGGVNCGAAGSYTDLTTPAPSINMWHHIVAVENGTTGQIFIDGSLVASSTAMDVIGNTANPVEIGRFGAYGGCSAGYYFTGYVANVAVYGAALSSTRVLAHYNAAKAAPPTGSAYPSAVLSDSPAGYWRLGETGPNNMNTSAQDISGNGLTGTYTPAGGYTLGQPGALGTDPGFSARFNGTSGFVSIGNPTALQMFNGTIEAWVYTTTTSQSAIAAKLHAWWFGVQATGKLGFYDMTTSTMRDSGVVVNDGRWHLVAVTFKSGFASGSQMYVDGVSAGSAFLMTVNAQANIVELAGYETTSQFLNGWLQDVAIYPTMLSPNRILAHYQTARVHDTPLAAPASYLANVTFDSPDGYWRLGESLGNTTSGDSSGFGNSVTTVGSGVTFGQTGALPGDSDTAATLNGTNTGYLSVPYSATFNPSGVFTLEFWVRITGGQGTWRALVASSCATSVCATYQGFEIYANPANNWEVVAGNGSTGWTYVIGGTVLLNQWYHLVATYSGSTLSLYANGSLLGTSTGAYAALTNSSVPLYIGTDTTSTGGVKNYFWAGSIDDVAIYGTALSAARIAAHYAAAWAAPRVLTVQDGRGTTSSTFVYNDDLAMTQVIDGLGQSSYYTFQHAGGRTVSVQDALGNNTTYLWNGRSAFQLDGTVSAGGIMEASISNNLAPIAQQQQTLIDDKTNQPPDQVINYAGASSSLDAYIPLGAALFGTWTFDYQHQLMAGVPSHSSPFVSGTTQQHQFQAATNPTWVPSGATLTQWVYFQPGAPAPAEIMLQFYQQDGASWEHRAYWGDGSRIVLGTDGQASRRGQGAMPLAGHWVALTVPLSAGLASAGMSTNVGMGGHQLGGIAYDVWATGSGGTTYWGPTILDFPPATPPADTQHAISTHAYNQTNDVIASVDPNGIATVTDFDTNGLARQVSTGIRAPAPSVLFEDPLMYINTLTTSPWIFEQVTMGTAPTTALGSATINGYGSLTQTHSDAWSMSDLYRDVSGLRPGTYAKVSVWVRVNPVGTPSNGGVQLWVDDGLLPNTSPGTDSPVQKRSAFIVPPYTPSPIDKQLVLPFLVDQTGKLRIHLVQMNMQGSSSWADVRTEDITPAPDATLQASRTLYFADFEQSTDRSAWGTSISGGAVPELLNDSSRARDGAWVAHVYTPSTTAVGGVFRTFVGTPGSAYHITVWVRTVASGSQSATSGTAQVQLTAPNQTLTNNIASIRTNGAWQQLTLDMPTLWYGTFTVMLLTSGFRGDVYIDDLQIEQSSYSAGSVYWFSWLDTANFSAVDLHIYNPGASSVAASLIAPASAYTPININVGASANLTTALASQWAGANLYPLKLITQSPVIASIRQTRTAGGFNEVPAQSEAAARTTLYFSYYDSTGTFANDNIHIVNPGAQPVSGTLTLGTGSPTAFSINPNGERAFTFSATATGPVVIKATGPVLASQRVWFGSSVSEVLGQSANLANTTVYFPYLANWTTARFNVVNPAWTSGQTWSLTATLAGGSPQNLSTSTSSELAFNYNAVTGALVKIVASVPVVASDRVTNSTTSFYEVNGIPAPPATLLTTYFNLYDSTTPVTADKVGVANPGPGLATGSVTAGASSCAFTNLAVGAEQDCTFSALKAGPVTITSNAPVVVSQRAQTSTNYFSEINARPAPAATPSAPLSVTVQPAFGQATVTWSAPASAGGSPITSYSVARSDGVLYSVTGTSLDSSGLTYSNVYSFAVAAVNSSGQGPWSTASPPVPAPQYPGPQPPSLPATNGWQLITGSTGSATYLTAWTGGVGNGPTRSITVASSASLGDVKDMLPIATLRSGSSYVVSAWVSSTVTGTIDLSLRDSSGNTLPMDQSTSCAVTTTPALCEGSLTYGGPDYQPAQLTLQYGGQGPRTITVSHPLEALSAERHDFSQYGRLTRTYDIFGHESRTDYDVQGLYPIDAVQRMSADYHQTVLADGPLGYWTLEDGSGGTATDLAGSHPLTVTGSLAGAAVLPSVPNVQSLTNPGDALSVASSSSVLAALNDANGQSIEMWLTMNGVPAYNDDVFALTGTGTGHLDRWNGDGTPYPAYFETARHHFNVQIPLTGVHYIVYTRRTAGRYRLYLDGVLVGDDPAGTFGVPATFYLGGNGVNLSFKGNIADVAIYNSELSAGQILTHYQVGLGQSGVAPVATGIASTPYATTVLADGPKGYWRLGESGGSSAADSSANGGSGAIAGGVVFSAGSVTPERDTAMAFDGASATISVPSSAALNMITALTMETWVYMSSVPPVFTNLIDKNSYNQYRLGIDTTGAPKASLQLTNGSLNNYVDNCPGGAAPAALTMNRWHHIAYTFSGSAGTVAMYVDGVQVCQSTQTNNGNPLSAYNTLVTSSAALVLGRDTAGTGYLNGRLDEVAVYGTALPAGRMLAHYQASIFGGRWLVTGLGYNSLGQRVTAVRFNGGSSITDQFQLDSWGRLAREVKNSTSGAADAQTNVVTGRRYDLNGNLVDRYDQASVSGSWIDTHYLYDGDNNQVAVVQNCVTTTKPCDAASNAVQNVVTATAYDALNRVTDIYAPLPGCAPTSTSCVPMPNCSAGSPPICTLPATPCSSSTCVDTHSVYDPAGRLIQAIANYGGGGDVSQANVTTQYAYDGDGHLIDVIVPVSNAGGQSGQVDEHRVYDALGRLVTVVNAYSIPSWMAATTQAETDYTLDLGGRIVSVKGPDVGTTTFNANRVVASTDYDDLGQPLSVTIDPSGINATSKTVYGPRGQVHTWTPPTQFYPSTGLETTQNLDLAGHVISVVKDDVTGGLRLTTTTAYDGYGRATDVTDARGIVTHTVYDALDRVSSVTQNYCSVGNTNSNCSGSSTLPDQNVVTSYFYDLAGNRTQIVNPRGIIQFTAFDALHRATSVTQDCQTVPTPPATSCGTQSSDQNVLSSQSFDQAGNVLTTTDPLSRINLFAYDALARRTSQTINCIGTGGLCNGGVTSGQNLTTSWQFDAHGDVLKQTSPRQCTSAAPCYNGASITDGLNLATAYAYDGLFRLIKVTEDANRSGLVTTYTYDPSGNMLTQTDGNGAGHTTTFTVDNLSRTTKVTDANNNIVQTNYDAAGEVVSTVNARGKTNSNTLDRIGRLVGVSYLKADAITALSQSFGYDADGNRISFSDTDVAQTTVSYDHLNRPSTVSATSPYGTTTYTYFMDGAVNTIVDANGTTTFTEDRLGRVATMVIPLIAGTTSYTYDAAGRLTSRTEANGIVTTVTYTGADQLASKTEVAGATTLASWTSVTYDLDQNRTAETLSYYAGNPYPDAQAGTSSYQYDTLDQLSQATLPSLAAKNYAYDPAHNLTNNAGTAQTFNSNESLHTACAVTFNPDADGNLDKDCNSAALSWNSLSQLEKYSTSETYTYDAMGRLTTVTNGANVTKFLYQGLTGQVIQELNSSNAVVRSYAWDGSRQLFVKSGSSSYYQITDPHGDNVAWASATALVGTEHFDPWGNTTYTPSGTTVPFGFQGAAGSWTDATTSFVSMGVRWYYPKVSEFLSSDPAAGTADPRTPIDRIRWLYGANEPLTNSDPTGRVHVAVPEDNCEAACMQQVADLEAQQREDRQHTVAEHNAQAHDPGSTQEVCGRGRCARITCRGGSCTRTLETQPETPCTIGRQDCGTYAQHLGTQLLNIACGVTVCPEIQSAQDIYKLATDPSGWWADQQAQSDADKAYWSDVYNTYKKGVDSPIGWIPGGPEAYFGMKWSADRLQDFDNDPGTASANIVVIFVSFAIPGPKVFRDDPKGSIADVHPSTIVGRKEAPINVPDGTNEPRTINGIPYSGHALDRMQAQGLVPSVVENTLKVGNVGPGNRLNATTYYDPANNVTVVQNNKTGRIVTVHYGQP
jgi:RHS repeat-associated protein